jgi:hypothetical protein
MRRRASAGLLGLLIAVSSGFCTERAEAGGAVLPGSKLHVVEQRIAVALAPDRTTVWTSFRFEGDAGPVGVVIPVPSGASLDTSSDAWFEALEIATAPRVFPPEGESATCPGKDEPASDFHMTGAEDHVPSLVPEEIAVLEDAAAVSQWADLHGLDVGPDTALALSNVSGKRFLAARFQAPPAGSVTPTLRVVLPGADPTLPLALVRATGADLLVTTWVLSPGLGSFAGATEAEGLAKAIVWNAKTGESSYAEALRKALSEAGPKAVVLECAGHEPLASNVPIAGGTAAIDGVISTFFERAAAYGNGSPETKDCILKAAAALASVTPVGASCPRADLGVVDGSDTCVEQAGGYTDPEALRCGAGTDDLAVALAGLVPSEVWLTRQSMRIAAGAAGDDWAIQVAAGKAMTPVLEATGVDVTECNGPDGGAGGSSTSGSSGSGSGTTSGGNTSGGLAPAGPGSPNGYAGSDMGCDCSGTAETVEWYDTPAGETVIDEESEVDTYDSGDDCSGDSTDSGGDNCSGDTSAPPSDDCSGDGSDTYDSGGDDCSGDGSDTYDSGGDDCDSGSSGSSGDDCDSGSSGSSGDDCDSGSSGAEVDWQAANGSGSGGDCSITSKANGKAKRRAPRLSAMTLGALALIAPLRRLGTRKRREGQKPAKSAR